MTGDDTSLANAITKHGMRAYQRDSQLLHHVERRKRKEGANRPLNFISHIHECRTRSRWTTLLRIYSSSTTSSSSLHFLLSSSNSKATQIHDQNPSEATL